MSGSDCACASGAARAFSSQNRDLAANGLHPACLLRSVPRNEGAERPAFCVQQDALCCWVLEQLACEECGLRKPLAGFPRAALDRALRRISRACVPGDVLPRGRGNIRCLACAMGSTDSKSMVLQTIQTGRIRGRVRMTLELEVPGTDAWEGVIEDRFSEAGILELGVGRGLKSIETELYAAGATWIQQRLRGPWDPSRESSEAMSFDEAEDHPFGESGTEPAEPESTR